MNKREGENIGMERGSKSIRRKVVDKDKASSVSSVPLRTQGKIDLRNESGRPMKVKVVGEVSEK